jgi:hypothetical protein
VRTRGFVSAPVFGFVLRSSNAALATTRWMNDDDPNGCDNSDGSPAGTVAAGKTGSMQGYFIIPLPSGAMQTSNDPHCDATLMTNANCTTTTFIDTHFVPCYFGGAGTCPVTTFFFHYAAGNQMLVEHEWKNASSDRGGNHGDIRSMNVP